MPEKRKKHIADLICRFEKAIKTDAPVSLDSTSRKDSPSSIIPSIACSSSNGRAGEFTFCEKGRDEKQLLEKEDGIICDNKTRKILDGGDVGINGGVAVLKNVYTSYGFPIGGVAEQLLNLSGGSSGGEGASESDNLPNDEEIPGSAKLSCSKGFSVSPQLTDASEYACLSGATLNYEEIEAEKCGKIGHVMLTDENTSTSSGIVYIQGEKEVNTGNGKSKRVSFDFTPRVHEIIRDSSESEFSSDD